MLLQMQTSRRQLRPQIPLIQMQKALALVPQSHPHNKRNCQCVCVCVCVRVCVRVCVDLSLSLSLNLSRPLSTSLNLSQPRPLLLTQTHRAFSSTSTKQTRRNFEPVPSL